MAILEREFIKLIGVEEQLLNAATAVRLARQRLGSPGQLNDEITDLETALNETAEHVVRTKRILLKEWRASLKEPAAA